MNKIINIRGGNAAGKTTTVREFLKKHNYTTEVLNVRGCNSDITVMDNGKIIACGKYDEEGCVGADRYNGGSQLIGTIEKIIQVYMPQDIIYEGYIYSTIAGLNKKIVNIGRQYGYEWISIVLRKDLDKQISDLQGRGSKRNIDPLIIQERNDRIYRAGINMKNCGAVVKNINVTNMSKAQMGGILEKEVY